MGILVELMQDIYHRPYGLQKRRVLDVPILPNSPNTPVRKDPAREHLCPVSESCTIPNVD